MAKNQINGDKEEITQAINTNRFSFFPTCA